MNDDLDAWKKMLQSGTVMPDENAKKRAINMGLSAFDEKKRTSFQGKGWLDRLIDTATFGRRFSMKPTYAALGVLSVAVLTIGLVTSTHLQPPLHPQQAPIAHPLPPATADKTLEGRVTLGGAFPEAFAPVAAPEEVSSKELAEYSKLMSRHRKEAAASLHMAVSSPAPDPMQPGYYQDEGRDRFTDIKTNPTKLVKEEPVSTFSIDVDTASYSFVRSALNNNQLPQKDAVRIEEMVNYFPYDYAGPKRKEEPFKANVTLFDTPWNKGTKLMHIGIKGYEVKKQETPRANLVFLIDTSGSMLEPNKLPLVQNALKLMLDAMSPDDTVAIVTYAGSAGTALAPTKVKDKAKIVSAIDALNAGGSTAGAEGIRQAYALAEQNFDKKGVNRVLLATDGDFNVGITDEGELKSFIERKRESGIFLSVLGFGRGNYNDALMQTLAQNGNGNAAYIDTLNEARKALVEESSSTLFPIAKDVKIQVEFNPAKVAEYRLIGYETRILNREDFNNDKVDAGDIGAGHTVTAIYEITPVGSDATLVDDLRYGKATPVETLASASDEYAFVKIRYKQPEGKVSKLITTPVTKANEATLAGEPAFATAVAAFGQLLRGDATIKAYSYDDVIALAQSAKGEDPFGYRAEFINLVRIAKNAPAM